MRDDICTIPVSEIFEEENGCPLCRMHDKVEERIINYILGDAMMEPDVRVMTNEIGFCPDHYAKMMSSGRRLQLSLMLSTHLKEIEENVINGGSTEKKAKRAKEINDNCFICNKMNWGLERMVQTIYRVYENEEEFRTRFNNQPQFCFKHYEMLMSGINRKTVKKHGDEMAENLTRITGDYLKTLIEDVDKFCSMYDYHNIGNKDFGNSKDSAERTVKFLTMGQK